MRRFAAVLLICLCRMACAQENLYPMLEDPLDRTVQQLAVMSQRDEAFEGVRYNGGDLMLRGCLPVSMANSVIAALGVTDRETAVQMVEETAQLLVFPRSRGEGRVEMRYLPSLLSVNERTEQEILFPGMGRTVGRYPGEIRLLDGWMDAQTAQEHLGKMTAPCMLVGKMTVYPDWTEMIRMAEALEAMGLPDARILIAHASAGTESSGAPLRSGEGGHYVAMLIHVKTFVEEGRMYLLDSLPRALKGEVHGYTEVLRRPYPCEYTAFRSAFDAARISPTVVRFLLADRAAWQAADEAEKSKMLAPMILFGPLVVMISCGEAQL